MGPRWCIEASGVSGCENWCSPEEGEAGLGAVGLPQPYAPHFQQPGLGWPLPEQTSSCPPLGPPPRPPPPTPVPHFLLGLFCGSHVSHMGFLRQRLFSPQKVGRAPRWGWFSSLLCMGLPTSLSRERTREPRRVPPHIPLSRWGRGGGPISSTSLSCLHESFRRTAAGDRRQGCSWPGPCSPARLCAASV